MPQIDYNSFVSPENDKTLVVRFYHDATENKHASHKEGRPVFEDVEMCEIVIPGDRSRTLTVPAHGHWQKFGNQSITYAQRFQEHYARFKANEGPIVEGTPLSEAPFLSMADKASLKVLQVYTIEALAGLTGQALKNIGSGGLAKQQAAVAYLSKASGTADTVKMQQTIAELQAQVAALQPKGTMDHDGDGQMGGIAPVPVDPPDRYESMTADALKDYIQKRAGSRPKGNPSNATLVAMARELDKELAAA